MEKTMPRQLMFMLVLAVIGLTPTSEFAQAKSQKTGKASTASGRTIEWNGELQGANRKPIAGIYPLTFAFHNGRKSNRSVWSESHFVAVGDGQYQIVLGNKNPIGKHISFRRLYLSVSVTGGDEIIRERIEESGVRNPIVTPEAKTPPVAGSAPARINPKGGQVTVDYAERAGTAVMADHATQASKLGDMSLKDLLERIKRQSRSGKVTIGTKTRYSSEVGGGGGFEKDLVCPKGYVVTGVKARSGKFIDSLQLICSPLE
jgi:hypothetical protein